MLSLVGEAGIGKTVLWRTLVEQASAQGWRVLVAQPAEHEGLLGYSAIADLLGSAEAELAELPDPQREAIEVACCAPDLVTRCRPRPVAVGTTALLHRLSEPGPLLIAVDDVQWLDPSSVEVLTYACAG